MISVPGPNQADHQAGKFCLSSDGIHATLTLVAASDKKVKGQKAPDKTVEVDRSDLLAGELWHPDQKPENVFVDCRKLATTPGKAAWMWAARSTTFSRASQLRW